MQHIDWQDRRITTYHPDRHLQRLRRVMDSLEEAIAFNQRVDAYAMITLPMFW
jgi:hypothetical protein